MCNYDKPEMTALCHNGTSSHRYIILNRNYISATTYKCHHNTHKHSHADTHKHTHADTHTHTHTHTLTLTHTRTVTHRDATREEGGVTTPLLGVRAPPAFLSHSLSFCECVCVCV